ncbi:DUF3108 domain-containing protein [Hoeflea sp. AS16]|uniref:DUF3108 domain-containing protein n=1 Tax=unclassified Hoeflea TaxID=2614931 RepID=UPI00317CD102
MARVKMFLSGLMAVAALATAQQAAAEPVQVHTDYKVSLVGFPVASAKFVTEVDGKSYKISGDMRSSAFSDLFSRVRGNASVSGTVTADKLQASDFLVSYTSGKKKHRTAVKFVNGDVRSATNEPESKTKADDWVPLLEAHLRAVLDPLSGLLFPAGTAVCPRSLPIFDGESRATLHLTPIGVRPYRTKGFKGDAIVCGVRFEPNSGYRKNSSGIKYLKGIKGMEVWFAKHESLGLYGPVYAKVPTKIGKVIVAATRIGG